jgi:Zn-dependent M28 family amino/carboxypeptidase
MTCLLAPVRSIVLASVALACATTATACRQDRFDEQALLARVEVLASDRFEGRAVGSEGNALARALIVDAFRSIGLDSLGDGYRSQFVFTDQAGIETRGVNVVGVIPGTRHADRYLVLSAHYDHLGVRSGEVYNGADDNASGTSAIIAIAEYLAKNPPDHSVIVAALDGEERGLRGARAFIADPPVPLESVVVNVNLDMVSRSATEELYIAGTYHYPELRGFLEEVEPSNGVILLFGHDRPEDGSDDWTGASDHGPFHAAGIPFVYFGVEDHPGYHSPEDDFADITPQFYVSAVHTILDAVVVLDHSLAASE